METLEFVPKDAKVNETREFHFDQIAEIQSAMVNLVEQLKQNIENGEYDTLISDDVGGRIPTLAIRRIMREIAPENKLHTYFIASGRSYLPRSTERGIGEEKGMYDMLQDHLRKVARKTKKALVVTQYVHSGETLLRLADGLKEAGVDDFDIAALDTMPNFKYEKLLRSKLENNHLFVGSQEWHRLHEEHSDLTGVRKPKQYSVYPKRQVDVIREEGRDLAFEEWREIFDMRKSEPYISMMQKVNDPEKNAEFERRVHAPLTTDETKEIQEKIIFAREDVARLANNVVQEIWPDINQ